MEKEKDVFFFLFYEREKKMDGIPLFLLWRNFCQEEMKTFSFAEEEGKRGKRKIPPGMAGSQIGDDIYIVFQNNIEINLEKNK